MTCVICCENYNKLKNKKVNCIYCEYETCTNCIRNYTLSTIENAHCMNCKKEFKYEFLSQILTKNFMKNEYKKHREGILVDREKALLQETQPYVEREIQIENLHKNAIDIRKEIRRLKNRLFDIEYDMRELQRGRPITTKYKYVRKCPNDCNGFLSENWDCSLCNVKVCSKCHEIKEKSGEEVIEHECKPENVETAKLLMKDTKPCPNCGVLIHKIEGCDQMWCVMCKIAFSWRTGQRENVIHNPHYYEYLRQNGGVIPRQPGDILCGREINQNFIYGICVRILDLSIKRIYTEICRNIIHIRYSDMNRFHHETQNVNRDLRINFLRKFITEDYWKIILQRREKKFNKDREYYQIIRMFIDVSTDILYRIDGELKNKVGEENKKICLDGLKEIYNLVNYANTNLQNAAKIYNSNSPYQIPIQISQIN